MGSARSGRLVPLDVVMRCERLVAIRGATAVAEQLGVDAATVRKIRRGVHSQQRLLRSLVRCPGCGGLVAPPCQLCAVRRSSAELLRPLASEFLIF
jgi:hypothetical protein